MQGRFLGSAINQTVLGDSGLPPGLPSPALNGKASSLPSHALVFSCCTLSKETRAQILPASTNAPITWLPFLPEAQNGFHPWPPGLVLEMGS